MQLSIALVTQLKPDAQTRVKQLCAEAVEQGIALPGLIAPAFPDIDWTVVATAATQLGDAQQQARIFVKRVHAL